MSIPLNLLMVEDSEDDSLLIAEELTQGGYDVTYERVETRPALEKALEVGEWDIIIIDYSLPSFTGLEALELSENKTSYCPCLIVSGVIDEETAVKAMRAGAQDYVLKDNLARLVPAVERELREAEVRRQRMAAEQALGAERERTATILESITDAFYAVDTDWRITYANREAERLLNQNGYSVIGRNVWDEFPSCVRTSLQPELQRSMSEQVATTIDLFHEVLERWYNVRAYPSSDGLSVYFGDITDRKLAEQSVRESREDLKRAQAVAHTGSWRLDARRNELLWSDETYRIFGVPYGIPLNYETFLSAVHPEDREYVDQAWNAAVGGEAYDIEHRIVVGEAVKWVRERAELELDEHGQVAGGFGTVHDITERKQAEDELARSRVELEEALIREHHYSLLLQRALLPSAPSLGAGYTVVAEYVPAYEGSEIGGDFYDVFQIDDRMAGVLIGDVAGKGLEAAAMAAITRSTLHAFVHETQSPAEALRRANSVLHSRQVEFESFVTVFLVIIDIASGQITYSSAGHPPPLIHHYGRGVEALELGELPLALLDEQHFTDRRTQLDPGDKLVMYTDGISEARHGGAFLDVDGIGRLLSENAQRPTNELAKIVIAAATDWGGGKLQDDAAVVVVERLSTG